MQTVIGVFRQALGAVAPRDFAAEHRADGAIRIADRQLQFDRLSAFQRRLRQFKQLVLSSALSRP